MEATAAVTRQARDAVLTGMSQAFERLFLREYGRVAGIAYRVVGDAAEAEDVAQEVFTSFYRKHSPEASYAPAWLYAAAAHRALNAIRTRTRRERRETAAATDIVTDPAEEAMANETHAEVRTALGRLPEATAALLVLRHSGLTYAECGSALGIATDQVGTRLRRAQEAFRKEVLRGQAR